MSKKTSHMRSLLDVIKSDEEQNTNQQEREPQNKKTVNPAVVVLPTPPLKLYSALVIP